MIKLEHYTSHPSFPTFIEITRVYSIIYIFNLGRNSFQEYFDFNSTQCFHMIGLPYLLMDHIHYVQTSFAISSHENDKK